MDTAALHLYGEGPSMAQVREFADLPGMTLPIKVMGHQPPARIAEALRTASLLVFPSICFEGMPITILEAFASGVPVIASDHGVMQTMIRDGETGLLFKPGDAVELAEKMKLLLSHPNAFRRMGENARREYEAKYTPDKNYQTLMDIYQRVATANQGDGNE